MLFSCSKGGKSWQDRKISDRPSVQKVEQTGVLFIQTLIVQKAGTHFFGCLAAACALHFFVQGRNIISRSSVRQFKRRGDLLIREPVVEHERDFHFTVGEGEFLFEFDLPVIRNEPRR